ncbi:hypothetical protein U3516DRAFT_852895 [Neocallimastix sp. 'constans']
MNINILYIILLISITTNANIIIHKRNKIDNNISTYDIGTECDKEREISEYMKCMPFDIINLSNYKEKCLDIKSEKCQNFYNDPNPLKYFPKCSQIDRFKEVFKPNIFQFEMNNIQAYCQTNENDELCPLSLFKLTLTENIFGSSTLLNDTCESKKCTDSYIEFLSKKTLENYAAFENSKYFNATYTYDVLVANKKVISQLKSNECKSMHVTNNSITIRINRILLFTLFLLLILFY